MEAIKDTRLQQSINKLLSSHLRLPRMNPIPKDINHTADPSEKVLLAAIGDPAGHQTGHTQVLHPTGACLTSPTSALPPPPHPYPYSITLWYVDNTTGLCFEGQD